LDPLVPSAQGDLAWFLFEAKRYSECVETGKAVRGDESALALCHAKLGQRDEALAAAGRAAQSSNPVILGRTATAYAIIGSKDRAEVLLGQMLEQMQQRYICGFNVATVYAALGDKDKAFAWLEKAFVQRSD